jgi:putative intracellular protease/amidase/ADP-ribose pyrophosphatase YjhB (NUDIX family)
MRKKIYILLYPDCISFEITLAAELLSKKYEIVNASPNGKNLPDLSGIPVKVQCSYAEIDLDHCVGILVPGGDPSSIIENKEIDSVLQKANERGLMIAAICAGPLLLAKAGLLVGKRIAHGYNQERLSFLSEYFETVETTEEQFVADKNILTAKPEAHIDFAVEIACRLDCVDSSKPGRLKEYYKGTLGRKIRPLALAVLKNEKNQFLLHKAFDGVKSESFYRPLGGGIEFHETGEEAIVREIQEEIGQRVSVNSLVATFENIFVYEGKKGHEIVLLYDTNFLDIEVYDSLELDIFESGKVSAKAVWKSLKEIELEGAKLYPLGIEKVLR